MTKNKTVTHQPFHRVLSVVVNHDDGIGEVGKESSSGGWGGFPMFVGDLLYLIKVVDETVLKIYEIKFRISLDYNVGELEAINLPCEEGDGIEWMTVSELNGFIYLFAIMRGKQQKEIIFKLKINNEKLIECQVIYNKVDSNFLRIECPIIADSQRNCFYWFCGLSYNGHRTCKDCIKFNLETNEWEELTKFTMGFVLHTHSSIFWKNRYVIIFGGFVSSCYVTANIIAFDVEKGKWYSVYHIDDFDDDIIPPCYPRYNSGISLVSNKWACKYDKSIPDNDETDTLIIYGGCIDCFVSGTSINTDTHEVMLFHLNESTFLEEEVENSRQIPFSLTDYCTPDERKLPKIHERSLDNNAIGEFKILPSHSAARIYRTKHNVGQETLVILSNTDRSIIKVDLSDSRSLFSCIGLDYWDVCLVFSNSE